MLIRHPRIYPSVTSAPTDALLVRDGRVAALGATAVERATADDEVLEPTGACVFPALCDAHIHMWGLGLRRGSVSLGSATNTDEVYALLEEYDVDRAPSGWALGKDWDQNRWSDARALDIDRLDAIFGTTPLVLRRIDGHALWVNTAALRASGIDERFDPGPNGHVARRADGRPSGLLVDDAMNPVLETMPAPTVNEDRDVFLETCAILRRYGIGSAHIAWMPLDRMQMLTDLRDAGRLPLRLNLYLDGRAPGLDAYDGPWRDDWIVCGGVKYFADGALGSRGAHVHDPYPDGTHGLVLESEEHLTRRAVDLAARGWQLMVHAIGDAANTQVLDAFEAMDADDRARTRPRIEHVQMVRPDDIPRFGELGVVASVQPIHMYSDAAWADELLTEDQLSRLFPWARVHASAPIFCGGSDYPIEDPNPWHGIATAISRRDRKGRTFRPDDAVDRQTALLAYTEHAAMAGHRERDLGKLEPGYLADFCVLSDDPLTCSVDELWEVTAVDLRLAGSDR